MGFSMVEGLQKETALYGVRLAELHDSSLLTYIGTLQIPDFDEGELAYCLLVTNRF